MQPYDRALLMFLCEIARRRQGPTPLHDGVMVPQKKELIARRREAGVPGSERPLDRT